MFNAHLPLELLRHTAGPAGRRARDEPDREDKTEQSIP